MKPTDAVTERVAVAMSGGVDSSVAAALIQAAVGDQLTCVFVNNGLLREGEAEAVRDLFGRHFAINLHYVDAGDRFLARLAGVTDPERKRKLIGHEFIQVFEEAAAAHRVERIPLQLLDAGDALSHRAVVLLQHALAGHHARDHPAARLALAADGRMPLFLAGDDFAVRDQERDDPLGGAAARPGGVGLRP